MSTFKVSKKQIHTDVRSSIIARHESKIHEIESERKNLKSYKDELESLKRKDSSKIDEITALTNKIKNIESNRILADYLFNAMDFIKNIDNSEKQTISNECNGEISKYIKLDSKNDKELLYKNYISTCFPEEKSYSLSNYNFKCNDCGNKLINDTSVGINVCYTCGNIENFNITSVPEWNHSETHEFNKPFCYKRTNHFREWISQTQGRENISIPDEIINCVIAEIKKERITDKKDITYSKIKEFLKKLKLNKYYEHIPHIITKITGEKRTPINQELENTLIQMFNEIQKPFEKCCPKTRKNFLSYSYTLYKFFQLLEKEEYLKYFPLLKSREKMYEQDAIWKCICKELNWTFISSM
jgi:hypothetical protein